MDRMRRVNELIKRELSTLFERLICSEVTCLVTLTTVKTSPDLHHADVYVSVMGSEAQHASVYKMLLTRRVELQRHLARAITLKYTPVLRFHLDESAEQADRVLQILNELDADDQS